MLLNLGDTPEVLVDMHDTRAAERVSSETYLHLRSEPGAIEAWLRVEDVTREELELLARLQEALASDPTALALEAANRCISFEISTRSGRVTLDDTAGLRADGYRINAPRRSGRLDTTCCRPENAESGTRQAGMSIAEPISKPAT